MTGTFELFHDEDKHFRFRLRAPDGTVMAVSRPFPDKAAAVAGITAVREYAGMSLITDLCPGIPLHKPWAKTRPAARTTSPVSTGAPARPGHSTRDRDPRRHRAS